MTISLHQQVGKKHTTGLTHSLMIQHQHPKIQKTHTTRYVLHCEKVDILSFPIICYMSWVGPMNLVMVRRNESFFVLTSHPIYQIEYQGILQIEEPDHYKFSVVFNTWLDVSHVGTLNLCSGLESSMYLYNCKRRPFCVSNWACTLCMTSTTYHDWSVNCNLK